MSVDVLALIEELAGYTCRCGDGKMRRQTFCRMCYARLPRRYQLALYRRVGAGYEEAYAAAAEFLDAVNCHCPACNLLVKQKNDAKLARLGSPKVK